MKKRILNIVNPMLKIIKRRLKTYSNNNDEDYRESVIF